MSYEQRIAQRLQNDVFAMSDIIKPDKVNQPSRRVLGTMVLCEDCQEQRRVTKTFSKAAFLVLECCHIMERQNGTTH
jgi:hypothetical protein